MWFFSKFLSDEPGSADSPVIESDDSSESQQAPIIDYVLAMMETGKL